MNTNKKSSMHDKKFIHNNLSEAEAEALTITIEECAEVIQACTKMLRFGKFSKNPNDVDPINNKEQLEIELGQLVYMTDILLARYLIDWDEVEKSRIKKKENLDRYSNFHKNFTF